MIEFFDYSGRRGALVTLLPKIHALLTENAQKDKLSGISQPEHIVTWQQKKKAVLLDINWRFLVCMDGPILAGLFFYRYQGSNIYIEDLHVAWAYRNNKAIIEGLLKKLEYDANAKDSTFFAGERIKTESDKEILASVGFKQEHEGGWENVGSLSQAVNALKLRYNR